jgi:hypothetical protein
VIVVATMITTVEVSGSANESTLGTQAPIGESERGNPTTSAEKDPCLLNDVYCEGEIIPYEIKGATITGFNTVEWQTDETPCIAAGGNICGKDHVVACPRSIPLGTRVSIAGIDYTCLDRLALKYDARFDISFDKDIEAAIKFGKQKHNVKVYEER